MEFRQRWQFGRTLRGGLRCTRNSSGCRSQLIVRKSGGALEAAAQFPKTLRAACIAALLVNLLEMRGEFRGAAVVAGAQDKVEQLFECGRVSRCAPQDRFEQSDGFLRQAVAGKKIHVGKRLGNEFFRFLVERCFRRHFWFCDGHRFR